MPLNIMLKLSVKLRHRYLYVYTVFHLLFRIAEHLNQSNHILRLGTFKRSTHRQASNGALIGVGNSVHIINETLSYSLFFFS